MQPSPPVCPEEDHETTRHGVTINDKYFWLRERGSERVLNHLKAENAYTEGKLASSYKFLTISEMLKHTQDLQKKIYDEMLSRIKQTDEEVPYPHGKYLYYSRTVEGAQYSIHCRKIGEAGEEEVGTFL